MSPDRIADPPLPDAVVRHWAERILPPALRPYARLARLERPIGWWLLLLPGWWSIGLAQIRLGGGMPDLQLLVLFLIGAIVMRAAGCTFNDIVDRDIDAKVARTRNRPLPSGQVSVRKAAVFLAILLAAGLLILLRLNALSMTIGAASLGLVAIYPFMKRVTYWPQFFLGLAFNWGALLGWTAATGRLELPAILLYAGGVFWTLAYDTLYALQDREDDALLGVKSTAIRFGASAPRWIKIFFTAALLLILAAGVAAGAGVVFVLAVLGAALHAAWQLGRLDVNAADRCLMLFRSNRDFGLIIFAGAFLAALSGAQT